MNELVMHGGDASQVMFYLHGMDFSLLSLFLSGLAVAAGVAVAYIAVALLIYYINS
jgi:hypothetical protein